MIFYIVNIKSIILYSDLLTKFYSDLLIASYSGTSIDKLVLLTKYSSTLHNGLLIVLRRGIID